MDRTVMHENIYSNVYNAWRRKQLLRSIDDEKPHYVYFAGRDNSIKIGYTRNLKARLSQIGNVELINCIECDNKDHAYKMEQDLHALFKDCKINKEWFYRDKVNEKINELISQKHIFEYDVKYNTRCMIDYIDFLYDIGEIDENTAKIAKQKNIEEWTILWEEIQTYEKKFCEEHNLKYKKALLRI